MSKKKPNYAQFMKRPAPLELSPPSDPGDRAPLRATAPKKPPVLEEDLPWGQVIVEFSPDDSVSLDQSSPAPTPQRKPTEEASHIPEGTIITEGTKILEGAVIRELADDKRLRAGSATPRQVPLSRNTHAESVPLPQAVPVVADPLPSYEDAPPPLAVLVVGLVVVVALFFAV